MESALLEILRCPHTRQRLEIASAEEIARYEEMRAAGQLRFKNGNAIPASIESALVTEDRSLLYRVESGIPILLPDESIALTSSQAAS